MTPRVGIVAVSHSAPLAEASLDLALAMAPSNPPRVILAAGTEDGGVGTDAARVAAAIEEADEGAGVLVLMDLGSAVMSAELALEFCPPEIDARLVPAPFVEGMLAAVVRAAGGADLDEVAREATQALSPKVGHLGGEAPVPAAAAEWSAEVRRETSVRNAGGLHARPAAQLASAAAEWDAAVRLRKGAAVADARSPLEIAALDARPGAALTIEAAGAQAAEAVDAVVALLDGGFGEAMVASEPPREAVAGRPVGVSPGKAVGAAWLAHAPVHAPAADGVVPEPERDAAREAVRRAAAEVAASYRDRAAGASGQATAILEATAAMAQDPAIVEASCAAIERDGVVPARAVWDVVGELSARYEAAGGVLAARVTDLCDVRDRLIARLTGAAEPGTPPVGEPFVVVAHDLAPADTALLDATWCKGIVTEIGSPTSHTAILARELGIPAVVGVDGAVGIAPGTTVFVDGTEGIVVPDPDETLVAEVAAQRAPQPLTGPGRLADGDHVALLANIGVPADAEAAVTWGAEGVGLFRTEFCFLDRPDEPSIDEQVRAYRTVLAAMGGRKVVFRTLDAGSDKPLPFVTPLDEPNPSLGVRGFRTSRLHPGVLARQLEAIASAAASEGEDPWVMAPMVSTVEEAARFVAAVREAGLSLAGIMIETPSAAALAHELCEVVDFVSVGTNDLAQYVMAADRLAPDLSDLTDPWQPAVLRALAQIGEAGRASGTPVGVCGESAGIAEYAPVLVGLGVTSLSMSPRRMPAVADALAGVDRGACERAAQASLRAATAEQAREAALAVLGMRPGGAKA